jgi:hypothetical protein
LHSLQAGWIDIEPDDYGVGWIILLGYWFSGSRLIRARNDQCSYKNRNDWNFSNEPTSVLHLSLLV